MMGGGVEDQKIVMKMKQQGKVKVNGFDKMVEKYGNEKYGKKGWFDFVQVNYEFYDKNHKVYNVDQQKMIHRPENRKVSELLPFFFETDSVDDVRMFSVEIPGITDIDHFDEEILKYLPKGVHYITEDEISQILLNEGYTEPFFDHYYYSIMDCPNYNLYAKPIGKTTAYDVFGFNNNLVDYIDEYFSTQDSSRGGRK